MLTKLDPEEVPTANAREWSPARKFAEDAVAEFVRTTKPGDVCEVTGFEFSLKKLTGALSSAIYRQGVRGKVRASQRRGRAFLIREK